MNRCLARWLVGMYPRGWRQRYGAELQAMLEDGGGGVRAAWNVMTAAAGERMFPTMEGGMGEASALQRWGARAPWAVFGVAPVVALAAAYSVALLILWTGWQMFLPAEKTPFVPVDGWAIAYFGAGRMLYFYAPMVVGVVLAWAAVRARARFLWPLLGAMAMAAIDGVIQVRTVRPTLSEAGSVHLEFADWHPATSIAGLAVTILVYLLFRARRARHAV
ncbi:hypothetical protein DYQ86_08210 [Acidobacteria bacterium AB60]|nr:hypothetical protein DYQ86_08210 [Acidobacteria bacterium AB60]